MWISEVIQIVMYHRPGEEIPKPHPLNNGGGPYHEIACDTYAQGNAERRHDEFSLEGCYEGKHKYF